MTDHSPDSSYDSPDREPGWLRKLAASIREFFANMADACAEIDVQVADINAPTPTEPTGEAPARRRDFRKLTSENPRGRRGAAADSGTAYSRPRSQPRPHLVYAQNAHANGSQDRDERTVS